MIKNIIFDFGGVILKHKSSLMEDKISQIFAILPKQALEIWKKNRQNLLIGKISSKQFLEKLKHDLKSEKDLSETLRLWKDIYIKQAEDVDWQLLDFIEGLKKNYRIYLFTDTIDIHDEYNATRGIYDRFTDVFKSHEEGLSKLNDDAFMNVLKKIDTKPEECVYIDDLESNVERARTLGIRTILYKDREKLIQELFKLGIKINLKTHARYGIR